jgi:hypothetical protein
VAALLVQVAALLVQVAAQQQVVVQAEPHRQCLLVHQNPQDHPRNHALLAHHLRQNSQCRQNHYRLWDCSKLFHHWQMFLVAGQSNLFLLVRLACLLWVRQQLARALQVQQEW